MKYCRFLLFCLSCAAIVPSQAADVLIPEIKTTWTQAGPATSTSQYTADLSGENPSGQATRVMATASQPLLWVGGFWLGSGPARVDITAIMTLSYLGLSDTVTYTWGVPEDGSTIIYPGGGAGETVSNIAGFMTGPQPRPLFIDLPAGADLSLLTLTLTQQMGGLNVIYTQSELTAGDGSVSLPGGLHFSAQSIPEPGIAALGVPIAILALGRRRR